MMELKNIIVAFDGNEESKLAMEYGVTLKKSFPEASLKVVHVLNERPEPRMIENTAAPGFVPVAGFYGDPSQVQTAPELQQDRSDTTPTVEENLIQHTESNVKRILSEHQIEGSFEVLEGNAADRICEYAEEIGADIIVVGNSSKSGLEKFFLGSTSTSIAKHAPCSVFIAK